MKKKYVFRTSAVALSAFLATAAAQTSFASIPASAQESRFPAAFDLRSVDTDGDGVGDRCYVTSVKNQQPFSDCWGFAAVAAAEISLLGSVLENDPAAYKTLDLSEKQLAYFANKALDDPSNSQNCEGRYPTSPESLGAYYDTGGTPILATNIIAQGTGLTNESRDPLLEYKGKEGNKYILQIPEAGQEIDMGCYSPTDDWNLPESYRFMQDYIITESHLLPSPAITKDPLTGENIPYQYNPEATNAIKSELMHKRGVVIGYCTDELLPKYTNAKNKSHYTYEPEEAGHAVTIVGWDDNYSASNFTEGHEPPADGAWLIKNSWGAGNEEFPNKGSGESGYPIELKDADGNVVTDEQGNPVMVGSGYFWLSYYDQSIVNPESFVLEAAKDADLAGYGIDSIKHDQYDFMPVSEMMSINNPVAMKQANIFKAEDSDKFLAGISFNIDEHGSTQNQVKYSVYILDEDYKSPEDGVLMAEALVSPKYGGYYVEEIEPVFISKGQSYSIILEQTTGDGNYVINFNMSPGENSTVVKEGNIPVYSKAVTNQGESFMFAGDTWIDWTDPSVRNDLGVNSPDMAALDPQIDNFPIKGLYIETDDLYGSLGFSDDLKRLELSENSDSKQVGIVNLIDGSPVAPEDYKIEWSVLGDDTVAAVTPSADGTSVEVKGLKEGTMKLVAKIDGVKALFLPVDVKAGTAPTDPTDPNQNTEPEDNKESTEPTDPGKSSDQTNDKNSSDVTPDNKNNKNSASTAKSAVQVTPVKRANSPETGDKNIKVWIISAAAAIGAAGTAIVLKKRKKED